MNNKRPATIVLAGATLSMVMLASAVQAGVPQAKGSAALAAQGEKVYAASGCKGCHSVKGQGGKAGPALPNAKAGPRTVKWLMAEISNPKANNPKSIMPAYSARIKGNDLKALATYIASLKKK